MPPFPPSVAAPRCFALAPLNAAARALCLGAALCAAWPVASQPAGPAAAAPARQTYAVPAGSLGDALSLFAAQAALPFSFESALTQGKRSPGLQGEYTIEEGFARLLAGTGLEAVPQGGRRFALRQRLAPGDEASLLAPVTVSADVPTQDGAASAGYRNRTVSPVGPWEGRSLQDTPYSVHVTSAELIQNLQAVSPDQIYKIVPTAQMRVPQSQLGAPNVHLRGFLSSAPARNGIPGSEYPHGTTTEDVERVEILTGLSGFLYGPGNVGGLINYVSKRPTAERHNALTLGYTGGSNLYAHGDFGGPVDAAGRFGYRINAVTQGGETRVDDVDLKKDFVSAAFDWKLTDRLLLQVDGSYADFRAHARQAYWGIATGAQRPSANRLDPTTLWSQPWNFNDVESERWGANLRWAVTDAITLRAGYLDRQDLRLYAMSINQIQADGSYNQTSYRTPPQDIRSHGWNAFADVEFTTGPVSHKLTAGYLATFATRYNHEDGEVSSVTLTGQSLDAPAYVDEPQWTPHGERPRWNGYTARQSSVMIGDDIVFNEHWSMLAGLTRSTIESDTRANPSAAWVSAYEESAVTPTASLLYKPVPQVTTYVSYMEALEPGAQAANVSSGRPVTNEGEILDPLASEQIEAGVKASVGGMDLTAALFRIDKSLQYYDLSVPDQATFVQDGLQVHRGLELTATGKLSDRLTVVGGVTVLDARIRRQKQNPALEGKQPAGTAEQLFKLYGEYQVPFVPGLTFTGSLIHNGTAWGDAANTDRLPSYALLDAGARYATAVGAYPLTLRLNVSNLTDERYWVNSQYLGDPRTVLISTSLQF